MSAARRIACERLTPEAFAPFGTVIEAGRGEVRAINAGTCERHHALAAIEHAAGRRPILSIFRAQPRALPMELAMMERHPLGSQAFVPLSGEAWIAVVAPDEGGGPGAPRAFLAGGRQGVSYAANVWHHPLIALGGVRDFLVADADGPEPNLEEADYPVPYMLAAPGEAAAGAGAGAEAGREAWEDQA